MWRPTDWSQIEAAIGVVSEGQSLDFKNPPALVDGAEIAKDVAAMSVFGGVLAYGIDDQKTEVARAAPGVALRGQKDRMQQIVNANVTPPVFIEIQAIEDPGRAGHGVLIVSVPPSSTAPHAIVVNGFIQFPARSGTTTRYLGESELAELYARRAAIASAQETAVPLLYGARMPPWMTEAGLDMSGVGVMQVTASPLASRVAPSEYLLRERLAEAVAKANAAIVPHFISVPNSPGILDRQGWMPLEAVGWYSHEDKLPDGYLQRSPTYSATYLYGSGFSYQVTVPLEFNGKPYIWEHVWASNLVGALAITTAFYADDASAALLRVDVSLGGLDGARPGPDQRRFGGEPRKVPPYAERRIFSFVDAATDPVDAAESLLARFLASIHPSGSDVFRTLSS